MIKFFRKIRQTMIKENKVSKYILYAIGEIFLVVIGILIALSLNNLNAEKKTRILEIKILKEINSNLASCKTSFERTINFEKDFLESNLMILDYLDNKKPYDVSLDKAFGNYFWTVSSNPIRGGYDYLKSKGIDLVTNDSLRKNISLIFENKFSLLESENEVWNNNMQQNVSYPYHVNLFRSYSVKGNDSGIVNHAKPFNYDALLKDDKFKSINTEIIANRRWNINDLQNLILEVNELISQIDEELKILVDKK